MKPYLTFTTLSFIMVSFLVEIMMSTQPGFITYAGFSWFISTDLINFNYLLVWTLEGLVLGTAAFAYINPKSALQDGFRFGLMTGFLFTLMVLFNVMWQIDHSHYPFLAESLLSLTLIQVLGFALSGWLFGLLYEITAPRFPNIKSLWSLA
ncbi:hypothetical protein [Marinicella meishanensis]|uniref:hypothetical protein n=1 Tax=Marinicella meishanensis TaxID=2873263 RepID=UPI001CBCD2DB|nr:hypothetical protein [Marinicella sp. NBU2979]